MFIMREVWLLVFKCPSQAQVDNEYSKVHVNGLERLLAGGREVEV